MSLKSWDQTKFNAALKAHLENTSRTVERVVNGHAFYIARTAARLTHKTLPATIATGLGQLVTVQRTSKKGKLYNRKVLQLSQARDSKAPLAALIINKQIGDKGKFSKWGPQGLHGREMRSAIRYLLKIRNRSIAFIASGWIPAIKLLARYADGDGKATPGDVKQFGSRKGSATPARKGAVMVAKIINSAIAKHDTKGALAHYGGRGLQLAFDQETASITKHLADKMKPDETKANRRLA